MRVEIDLPDWVDERNIRITAGIELVAIKHHNEDFWRLKDHRCEQCGKCCTSLGRHFYPTINGECVHLQPEVNGKRFCSIALHRSRNCDNDPKKCDYITYNIVPCK